MNPSIDVVIPVHDPRRPLTRAIRSILAQRPALVAHGIGIGITVVCHNVSVAAVSAAVAADLAADDDVHWLEWADGTTSPAGPRNAALNACTADFICFLDSDDYLEDGALAAWWQCAQAIGAAAVIAPLRTPEGTILAAPRIRAWKPAVLDPLRDGLAYRSVPYGLLRREGLSAIGFRYAEGIGIGEDLEATLKLWFRGGPVAYPYGAPAYQQTNDAGAGRVTSAFRPLDEEFRWLDHLLQAPWLTSATLPERRAIALKLLRVHGIGALVRRGTVDIGEQQELWNDAERRAWAAILRKLLDLTGGSLPALSRRDRALARAAEETSDTAALRAAVVRHSGASRLADLLTANPLSVFSHDSVIRHYVNERRRTRSGVFASR